MPQQPAVARDMHRIVSKVLHVMQPMCPQSSGYTLRDRNADITLSTNGIGEGPPADAEQFAHLRASWHYKPD